MTKFLISQYFEVSCSSKFQTVVTGSTCFECWQTFLSFKHKVSWNFQPKDFSEKTFRIFSWKSYQKFFLEFLKIWSGPWENSRNTSKIFLSIISSYLYSKNTFFSRAILRISFFWKKRQKMHAILKNKINCWENEKST